MRGGRLRSIAAARRHRCRRCRGCEQPGQVEDPGRVVDRPHDGPVVDARADRPAGRGAPAGARLRQLLVGAVGEWTDTGPARIARQLVEQVGERLARRRQRGADGPAFVGRPEQDAGEGGDDPSHDPAHQPIGQRAVRGRQGHGEDERQGQRRPARHRVAAEQPGEPGEEGHDAHADRRQQDPVGHDGAEGDQSGAQGGDDEGADEAPTQPAPEVRHRHQAERAEGGEDRHRRTIEHEAGDGEQRRHQDRHPHRPAQDHAVGVVEAPAQQARQPAGPGRGARR